MITYAVFCWKLKGRNILFMQAFFSSQEQNGIGELRMGYVCM